MKKITFLCILLITFIGYAQQQSYNITFEPGTDGSDPNEWSTFENADGDNADSMVANPDTSGINASATALQMNTNIHVNNGGGSQIYAGVQSQQPGVFGTWFLETGNEVLTLMVYKSEISETRVQFVNATNGTVFQLAQSNTVINQWETLTYDLTAAISSPENVNINRIVIFPDWQERSQINTNLIDNIMFSANAIAPPSEPAAAAPTPTNDPGDVISMFSDAYTDVPVDTWNTGWSQATYDGAYMVDGNATKKYTALNFNGIETVGPNLIDATAMTHLHMDVWTPDSNDFKIKLVDFGADEGFDGGDDTEHEITFAAPMTGEWISYDIPLTDFTGLTNTNNIAQMILSKATLGTIYVDNVFYYFAPPTDPTVAAPTPTIAPGNIISMFSDAYTDVPVDTWNTVWSNATFADVMVDTNPTKLYTNLGFNGIETIAGGSIDATTAGMLYFHMDVWTPNITAFRVKLVDFKGDGFGGANGDTEAELSFTPTQSQWVSIDIPLADFASAGMTDFTDISQYIISCDPFGSGKVYIDNVYFSTEASLSVAQFENNEFKVYPNPTQNSWNVKSNQSINTVQLFDVLGKQVLSLTPNTNQATINGTTLPNGLYFARIATNQGIETLKLIKR